MRSQFEAWEKLGFVKSMTLADACERFADRLSLAAIGATAKKAGASDARVVFDATHGVLPNYVIKVRDHVRCPTAADIKAWLAEQASEGGLHCGLVM